MESWVITEHGRSGHHALPVITSSVRDSTTDWEIGSLIYNSTLSRLQLAQTIDPDVWVNAFAPADAFPSGTRMLFQQTSVPTGWTKETSSTYDNAAFSCSTGAVSTGGSIEFETAFESKTPAGTIEATTLTEAQIPAHKHLIWANETAGLGAPAPTSGNQSCVSGTPNASNTFNYQIGGTGTGATLGLTSSAGSGGAHNHSFTGTAINLDVKFADCSIGIKD